jgi:hypothetical protein
MSTMMEFSTNKYRVINFMIWQGIKHFHVQEVPFAISDLAKILRSSDKNFAAADYAAQAKHDLVIEISRTAAPNSSSRFKRHLQNNLYFLHQLFSF